MNVTLHALYSTADVSACVNQLDSEFGSRLAALAAEQPPFERMEMLYLFTSAGHPLCGGFQEPRRGSYDKKQGRYLVGALVDYQRVISPSWTSRVTAYAEAAERAVKKIAKTRIADRERATLLSLVSLASTAASHAAPEILNSVMPVFIRDPNSASRDTPLLSFGERAPGMIELHPSDIDKHVQFVAAETATPPETGFKLYYSSNERLHYREAWIDDSQTVHEHWGAVGERGEHKKHAHTDVDATQTTYKALKEVARDEGYKPLAASRHATLVVEYPCKGTPADLARRHALEDFLNELTGWLGLGHVDGGSIGSGTMEVFCIVVDFAIAKGAISAGLEKSRFAGFSRIYRMK